MIIEERLGEKYRQNKERYFHVMGQGWYVFTRKGTDGPFQSKDDASSLVKEFTGIEETEKKEHAFWDDFFLR